MEVWHDNWSENLMRILEPADTFALVVPKAMRLQKV